MLSLFEALGLFAKTLRLLVAFIRKAVVNLFAFIQALKHTLTLNVGHTHHSVRHTTHIPALLQSRSSKRSPQILHGV